VQQAVNNKSRSGEEKRKKKEKKYTRPHKQLPLDRERHKVARPVENVRHNVYVYTARNNTNTEHPYAKPF
jgi:hypothetical protein